MGRGTSNYPENRSVLLFGNDLPHSRMKESAPEADVFFNTRLETSSISKGEHNKQVGCVELLAHATAVRYENTP